MATDGLSDSFEDPDGDPLTITVSPAPQHIGVTIDPATGKVTLRPEANWNGQEAVTFVASDGELQAVAVLNVTVAPVNDPPTVDRIPDQSGVEAVPWPPDLAPPLLGAAAVEMSDRVAPRQS